jgi:hypothetical protein
MHVEGNAIQRDDAAEHDADVANRKQASISLREWCRRHLASLTRLSKPKVARFSRSCKSMSTSFALAHTVLDLNRNLTEMALRLLIGECFLDPIEGKRRIDDRLDLVGLDGGNHGSLACMRSNAHARD